MEEQDNTVAQSQPISAPKRAAREAEEPAAWRPIETAPKDGTQILTYRHHQFGNPRHYNVVVWNSFAGKWLSVFNDSVWPPSHWMPLPEPPLLPAPTSDSKHSEGGEGLKPEAFMIYWWADGDRPRCRVQLTDELEPWLHALEPTVTPLYPAIPPHASALSRLQVERDELRDVGRNMALQAERLLEALRDGGVTFDHQRAHASMVLAREVTAFRSILFSKRQQLTSSQSQPCSETGPNSPSSPQTPFSDGGGEP